MRRDKKQLKLPNFIIFGATRSGTTSLYEYMKEHPDIYMSPVKETNYFADRGEKAAEGYHPISTEDQYASLFEASGNERVLGEASPIYLESPTAAMRIKSTLPHVKLLASLRNPVDRAFSNYLNRASGGMEPMSLEQAFKSENVYLVQAGFYYDNLKRYYDLFPSEKIKICLYDDLRSGTLSLVQDIYAFLGVDDSYAPNVNVRHNTGSFPRNRIMAKVLTKPRMLGQHTRLMSFIPNWMVRAYWVANGINKAEKPAFSEDLRKWLCEIYHDDILKTQGLIQRDLNQWLKP